MRWPCVVLLPIAACTGIQPTRTYAGAQTPIAGTCDPRGSATLTRRGNAVELAPADGTLTLTGTAEDTHVSATLTVPGIGHTPYTLTFAATLAGDVISGTLVTPRCRYALSLHRIGS